jgi:hypothetical protein
MSPIKVPSVHDNSDTEDELSPVTKSDNKRRGEEKSSQSKKIPKKLSFNSNVQ